MSEATPSGTTDGIQRDIDPLDHVSAEDISWVRWINVSHSAPADFEEEVGVRDLISREELRSYHAIGGSLAMNVTYKVHLILNGEVIDLRPSPLHHRTASPVTIGDAVELMSQARENDLLRKSPTGKFAYLPSLTVEER